MDNELIVQKSWFSSNRKWFVPLLLLVLIAVVWISSIAGNLTDFAHAYADPTICQKAIAKANNNPRVVELLGAIEPIDQLAMLEGNAKYSKAQDSVAITVRVKGTKGNAKMDILANKTDSQWNYSSIQIRIKNSGEVIQVLD